jgi:hypothetical protein
MSKLTTAFGAPVPDNENNRFRPRNASLRLRDRPINKRTQHPQHQFSGDAQQSMPPGTLGQCPLPEAIVRVSGLYRPIA